jgi:hypothetical protein
MKDRESVCARTFTLALIVVFLFSSAVGTIAAAKPERPGKPVETWDLEIWIGEEGEDIVLEDPDFLFAQVVPCSGGLWDQPVGKGAKGYVSAHVSLYSWYEDGGWKGDATCGTYYLTHVEGESSAGETTYLDEFHHDDPGYTIIEVSIGHQISPLGQNYWWFRLQWINTSALIYSNTWEGYNLWAWTSKDSNEEGKYPEENVLSVVFNGAETMIFGSWDDTDGDGVPDTYDWEGTTSFTVTITRSPHVP